MATRDHVQSLRSLRRVDPRLYVVYVAFVLILVFFAIALRHDGFTSSTNLLNIVKQTTPVSVMAVGLVFVLSAGEIDLSIGSVVALTALATTVELGRHGMLVGILTGL